MLMDRRAVVTTLRGNFGGSTAVRPLKLGDTEDDERTACVDVSAG